eukprot:749702-Hanusia_phi.AAC.1
MARSDSEGPGSGSGPGSGPWASYWQRWCKSKRSGGTSRRVRREEAEEAEEAEEDKAGDTLPSCLGTPPSQTVLEG